MATLGEAQLKKLVDGSQPGLEILRLDVNDSKNDSSFPINDSIGRLV